MAVTSSRARPPAKSRALAPGLRGAEGAGGPRGGSARPCPARLGPARPPVAAVSLAEPCRAASAAPRPGPAAAEARSRERRPGHGGGSGSVS